MFHTHAHKLTEAKDSVVLNAFYVKNNLILPCTWLYCRQLCFLLEKLLSVAGSLRDERCKCVSGVDWGCLYNFSRSDQAPLV